MPDRTPKPGWAVPALLLAGLLAGCGPTRNEFAPPCPGQAILGTAANYDIYRGGSRDLTDLVLHSRIVGMQGTCRPGDRKGQLAVTVRIGVEATRGPAMEGRETDVPVFLAVSEGQTILDKRTVSMRIVFPSNVDRVTLSPGDMNLVLPVKPGKSGAAYTLITGFQVAP